MATNLEISGALKRTQKGDADYYYGGDAEAWSNLAAAKLGIPAAVRPGKTIGVFVSGSIVEYWWPTSAVGDNDLVLKTPVITTDATPTPGNTNPVQSGGVASAISTSLNNAKQYTDDKKDATGGFAGLTLFKINFKNALNTFISYFTNNNTASRTYTFQDRDGTIADNIDLDTKVGITGNQTIGGNKTFTGTTTISATTPLLQLQTSDDSAKASITRNTTLNTLSFQNNVTTVGGLGNGIFQNSSNTQYITGSDAGFPTSNGTGINLTFSIWFKLNQGSLNLNLFKQGATTGTNAITCYTSGSGIFIQSSAAGQTLSINLGTNALVDNNFHNVIVVFNGLAVTMYVDKVAYPAGSFSSAMVTTLGGANGFRNTGDVPTIYGTIGQILVYNRSLSTTSGPGGTDEIQSIYNFGVGTLNIPQSGLIRSFQFTEGSGTTTADTNPTLGTTYPLTLTNGASWAGVGNGKIPVTGSTGINPFITYSDGINASEVGQAIFGNTLSGTFVQGRNVVHKINATYPFVQSNTGNVIISKSNTSQTFSGASALSVVDGVSIGTYAATSTAPTNGLIVSGPVGFGTSSPSSSYVYDANGATRTTGIVNIVSTIPESRWVTSDTLFARFQRSTASSNNLFVGKNNVLQVGGIGKALKFSPVTSSYFTSVDTGLPSGTQASFAFSFSIWVKLDTVGVNCPLFHYGSGSNSLYAFINTTKGLQFESNITNLVAPSSNLFTTNQWYHIVGTLNGQTAIIYVNGSQIATQGSSTYTVTLGGTFTNSLAQGNSFYMAGTIDQLLIYNTVLTPANIASIYNSGAGTSTPPATGLIRRYEFEEGVGSTTADINSVGIQYPLTLFNNPIWQPLGIVPVSGASSETSFFNVTDGLINGEKGIATWGDFSGRNQQQGRWFQWFQNNSYPLTSNNTGQWRFDPNNTNASLPTVSSTIDVAGNVTIGSGYSGTNSAPANGIIIQGRVLLATAIDNLTDQLQINGNINLTTAGNKLKIATGSNASIGIATLVGGSVTVNTTALTANSIIMLTYNIPNGNLGILATGTKTIGSSFIINSLTTSNAINTADISVISWWIIN